MPEFRVLQAAARGTLGYVETPDTSYRDLNWHAVLWLGRRHGILGFLGEASNAPLLARCPSEIRRQIDLIREVYTLRTLARVREICQLHQMLTDASIPLVMVDSALDNNPSARQLELGIALHGYVPNSAATDAEARAIALGHPNEASISKLVTLGRSPALINRGFARTDPDRVVAMADHASIGGKALLVPSHAHWLLSRITKTTGPEARLGHQWEIVNAARRMTTAHWSELSAEARALGIKIDVPDAIKTSYAALGLDAPAEMAGLNVQTSRSKGTPSARNMADQSRPDRVPFLATTSPVVHRMLELAEITPRDIVYDIGCGDGRIVVEAARTFGCRGVGIDADPVRIAEAEQLAAEKGVSHLVSFICKDLFDCSWADATVLCLYLLPTFLDPIRDRLQREARPGLRIVSHDYNFPDWLPERTEIIRVGVLKVSQIYLWRFSDSSSPQT